jgi:hypothetical protein
MAVKEELGVLLPTCQVHNHIPLFFFSQIKWHKLFIVVICLHYENVHIFKEGGFYLVDQYLKITKNFNDHR